MALDRTVRIGTRGSKLARWQSDWVAAQLTAPGRGSRSSRSPPRATSSSRARSSSLGIQGVFTKEIQAAVLGGQVDLAVHSLKDLPTQQVAGLALAATPPREDPADALVSNVARLARTTCRRARASAPAACGGGPNCCTCGPTSTSSASAATSTRGCESSTTASTTPSCWRPPGCTRLGWGERITELLAPPRMLPAPGQGRWRLNAARTTPTSIALVGKLDDPATRLGVTAERTVLAALHGGCSAPIAAWGRMAGGAVARSTRWWPTSTARACCVPAALIDLPQSYSGSESIAARRTTRPSRRRRPRSAKAPPRSSKRRGMALSGRIGNFCRLRRCVDRQLLPLAPHRHGAACRNPHSLTESLGDFQRLRIPACRAPFGTPSALTSRRRDAGGHTCTPVSSMPYGMYISAEGAQAQAQRLEVIANNLANVDTAGFKQDVATFQARFAEAIQQGTD